MVTGQPCLGSAIGLTSDQRQGRIQSAERAVPTPSDNLKATNLLSA